VPALITEAAAKATSKLSWHRVGVYYLVACAWSWPFFWRRDVLNLSDEPWPFTNLVRHWGLMWGPGIAALLCLAVFGRSHIRVITIFGTSWIRSVGFYLLPFLLLAALGTPALYGYHLTPLLAAPAMFVSIFGEELGWRGYLQDALRPLPAGKRFVLIGVLWEFWHFTTRTTHGWSLTRVAVTLLVSYTGVILLSFIIGYAAERSQSVVVATAIHTYVDLLLNNLRYARALLFVLPLWAIVIATWPRQRSQERAR
jgi:uncharacterized protein